MKYLDIGLLILAVVNMSLAFVSGIFYDDVISEIKHLGWCLVMIAAYRIDK